MTTPATCEKTGEQTHICSVCGDKETEAIAALDHEWGDPTWNWANDYTSATATFTCARGCEETETATITSTTTATCTADGKTTYKATVTFNEQPYEDEKEVQTEATGHQGGTATCQEKAVCEVCHEPYGDFGDHTPDKTDYIADEKGHWFACSLCGTELKDETYEEHDYTGGEQNCKTCDVTDSQYFYFTLLDDGTYSIAEQIDNETETILPTGEIKLPNYHANAKITAIDNGPLQNSNSELGAFFWNEATSITIPEGITTIGPYAFRQCTNLTSIEIPQGVTSIGYYAFEDCTSLESVSIPNSVTSIGSYAFSCCALKEIEIPDSVTSIGDYAFEYCEEIVSIDISNVISIGKGIFRDCTALESVTLPDGITTIVDSMFWNCTSLIFEIPDTVTTIGDQAFIGCPFTSITIPDGVTSIGGSTFADCTSLTSITIPESVTSIGDWAFRDCTSLTSITIPNSVTSIEDRAFWGCTALTSITIPESVTSIGEYAFEGCDNLTSVVFADTTSKWGMKRYSDYPVENTFTPSTPEANAEALTDTYLNRIWEKQTD